MNFHQLTGLIDYWSRNTAKFYPWGFAMNSQTARLETTRQIIYELGIQQIVETGAYRGTTTEWFAQFGLPTQTVEANPRYYAFSKARLRKFKNVSVVLSTSIAFLSARTMPDVPQLFYLDAHWEQYLPLREELELIFSRYTNAIVLIDDFKVHDDPGYGYDAYAPDRELTIEYINTCRLPKLWKFYPAVSSAHETGAKRGWIVLSSNFALAKKLSTISLLREAGV